MCAIKQYSRERVENLYCNIYVYTDIFYTVNTLGEDYSVFEYEITLSKFI